MIDLFVSLKRGVPSSRMWTITNSDGSARSLTGLTAYLLINQGDDATALATEITGTPSGSDVTFAIPALTTATIGGVPATTIPAGVYPCHLTLRVTAGGAQATDGKWSGKVVFDGGGLLATLEDLKGYLQINHSEDDANLWNALQAGQQWFESQVGRSLASTDYIELQDGNGGTAIIPAHYPVTDVDAVVINGETIPESTAYGVSGWYLNRDVIRLRGYFVTESRGNVTVTYTAGFSVVPNDVREAVVEVAAVMYRERDRIGHQSKNFGGESVTYYYVPPSRVVSTVEAYRRVL
jgi:hypothetical protein